MPPQTLAKFVASLTGAFVRLRTYESWLLREDYFALQDALAAWSSSGARPGAAAMNSASACGASGRLYR